MKKTLLTLSAIISVVAGACGQGSLYFDIPSTVGVNSVSSDPNDPDPAGTDWFLNDGPGMLTFAVYTAAYSPTIAAEAQTINADAANKVTEQTAVSLLQADFTQQPFGINMADESLTWSIPMYFGNIPPASESTYYVGTSASLPSGTIGFYALVVAYGQYEGTLVLNGTPAGYQLDGAQMNETWPDQNLLLSFDPLGVPVLPEPTAAAMAGLGGVSLLFLRSRKRRV